MRRLSRAIMASTAILALAAPAMAANVDTTGLDAGTIYSFGSPNTATYGQTSAPPRGRRR